MFSEHKYYAAFKTVRNKFRKYRSYELVGGALEYINNPISDKIESVKRHPWLVLLFVKWVLLDDNYPNAQGKIASPNDVIALLQSTYELADKLRMPDEYEHHTLFFRNMAFQQFLYQEDFYYAHFSRQSIMFSGLDKNHYISREFVKHTGLEVQEFLDLSLMLIVRFLNSDEVFLPDNWFSTVEEVYSNNQTKSFLSILSKDINELRKSLVSKDNGKRPASEHYEFTPLIESPLIHVPGRYLLTHKSVLFRRLEYFVYDIMRNIDAEKFMGKFGEIFERYVEKAIKYSGVKYITEKDIRKMFGSTGNQIDFIIQDDSVNIFIDAKAVEMNSQGKVTHLSKIIQNKTKQSILKAIKQAHDVIKKISDNKQCLISSSQNNYLLVVTYKDLYLGSGTSYYEVVAKEKMDLIYEEYKSYSCIPPDNIYLLTVCDFDVLADILNQNKYTLSQIFEMCKQSDKDPYTKKFDFKMHLNALDITPQTTDYLVHEKDKMFERILESVKSE